MLLIYDHTFEGLLTAIFEIYRSGTEPESFQKNGESQAVLFGESLKVITDPDKAERVAKKLRAIDAGFFQKLYKTFLSEKPEREMLIYRLVKLVLSDPGKIKGDYRNPDILRLKQIVKEMNREIHRMHAFVRFQRTADDIWFSAIEPDFDVLPLSADHFEKRYADQKWLIYDIRRRYGIFYDLEKTAPVQIDLGQSLAGGELSEDVLHEDEKAYQELWKDYFDSVNIEARRNMKLHIQQLPKRYWKYLFEKR